MTSCDLVSPETANAFKGEYWMETSSVSMLGDKVVNEDSHVLWSPVTIYEEKGKLFIQTNCYGAPYIEQNTREDYAIEEYRERPESVIVRKVIDGKTDEGDGGVVDIVVTDNTPRMVLMNGLLYVIRNGAFIKSHPIPVKSGSETVLNLKKFKPVEVAVTDIEGNYAGMVTTTYEYGPVVKNGERITWQVDLVLSNLPKSEQSPEFDRVVHKNTLYKR